MSVVDDIDRRLLAAGWRIAPPSVVLHRRRWTRWGRDVREEIVCLFDTAGRLHTWSYWQNRRVLIDGDTGRRGRLNEFLSNLEATDERT